MSVSNRKRIKALDCNEYLSPVDRWKLLSASIIKQAVTDWREATRCMSKPETSSHEMMTCQRETERFFRSSWFEMLSNLDGRLLLKKMKEDYYERPQTYR